MKLRASFLTRAPAVLLLGAAAGVFLAAQANQMLGIRFQAKSFPDEPLALEQTADTSLPPLEPIGAIVLPAGTAVHPLYVIGADELASAIALRTGHRPAVQEPGHGGSDARVVVIEGASGGEGVGADGSRESFVLASDTRAIRVRGASDLGNLYGMSYLAERLLAGVSESDLSALHDTITPALPHRFVDLGGVGIVPDSAAWTGADYSHHSRAFVHALLPDPPYVDSAALHDAQLQFREYVHRMAAYGYNGIVIKGFLEYVNFDGVGDGFEVYGPDSAHRQRHIALRAAFGDVYRYAHDLGLRVVLYTDMLALTPQLKQYLERRFGRLDLADPAIWDVYRAGFAELFDAMPFVDGVMIRIGEAGTVYNLEGWDYTSELLVTRTPEVQAMLRALGGVTAEHGKSLIFRSWSVGVGEVGAMHTRPAAYEHVLGGVELENLVVSTKYVAGDFYSFLPLNPTLHIGGEPRLVEFQARREFEGFGAFPNYLGVIHQHALQELRAANPSVRGVWVWTQEGGPLRAGPFSLYPFHGGWHEIDANVYVTGRLAWNPDADIVELTRAWVRRTFGADSLAVAQLTRLQLQSREAVRQGLYISEFARRDVRALGLEPPPMLWLFEWDIVTGSSAALSAIYSQSRANVQAMIDEGFSAVDVVRQMRELLASVDREAVADPVVYDRLAASLAYQEDLLWTLAWYRHAFLSHYHWLDTGDRASARAARAAGRRFEEAHLAHVRRYGNELDHPAFSFFDAEAGLAHARRNAAMTLLARVSLALIVLTFLLGALAGRRRAPPRPGELGLQALWTGWVAPARLVGLGPVRGSDRALLGVWPLDLLLLGALAFTSFLAPASVGLLALILAAYLSALMLQVGARERFAVRAAATAPILALSAIPLLAAALRGPGFFWYRFWTSDAFRYVVVVLATTVLAWAVYALLTALRSGGMRSLRESWGILLATVGAPLLVAGSVVHAFGLERVLTTINNELALLPQGLALILGITTHLNIPVMLPAWAVMAGGGMVVMGAALQWTRAAGR